MNVRLHLSALAASLTVLLVAAACGSSAPGKSVEPAATREVYESGVRFRARGDSFEIGDAAGASWRSFFVKGVNLGIAKPGRFPGELDATKEDYARWLARIAELNCNAVRLYTLHFPAFYQALGEYDRAHPEHPIYLIQGIWLDELVAGDYISDGSRQLTEETAFVVDAVHGNANIPERRGKAYGEYRHDVSQFVLAWLPGHEMDGYMVKASNDVWSQARRYDGRFVVASDGLPIEAWVAGALDQVVVREVDLYGAQHPVGWSNWPALDPIHHPTEPPVYGQDVVDVDFGRFTTRGGFEAGIFASYHVYPFNPEFIAYDPGYSATIDDRGRPNSYLGYLLDLKTHHRGVPLLVAEYGVPSSVGVAHVNETSYNHGGYSELEQGAAVADLFHSIVKSGAAGAIVFELMDEWFKETWLTADTTLPADRAPLWYDVLSPEQSFGLLSFYPTRSSITVDGDGADWIGRGQALYMQVPAPVAPLRDGRDSARTLVGLNAAADPAFLYLRLDVATAAPADFEDVVLLIGISTLPGSTGDRLFPDVAAELAPGKGLEAVVVLDTRAGVAELRIDERYDVSPALNADLPGGTAVPNDDGRYVLSKLLINSALFYQSMSFIPEPKWYQPGLLRRGDSSIDSLAHFQLGSGMVELRLPWHALWVTDPSSHQVLDGYDPVTEHFVSKTTTGFEFYVIAAARVNGELRVVDALPRSAFSAGSFGAEGIPTYLWPGWDSVDATERAKPVFQALKQAHAEVP